LGTFKKLSMNFVIILSTSSLRLLRYEELQVQYSTLESSASEASRRVSILETTSAVRDADGSSDVRKPQQGRSSTVNSKSGELVDTPSLVALFKV
jgi:hypothetical protein